MQQPNNQLQIVEKQITGLETNFNQLTASYDAMIQFKKEAHFALQALQNNDFLCSTAVRNQESLKSAILNIASVGLSLNPAEKAAYLVPRDGRVCLDISYMGLCDLATMSGALKMVTAELVRETDEFQYNGVGKEPTHKFNPFKDRGEIVGVYCVAVTPDDKYLVEMMSKDECYAIRDRSMAWQRKQSGPWKTDEGEMMKKTVIKRASKLWPKAPKDKRLFNAIETLNDHEGIDFKEERERQEREYQQKLEEDRAAREQERAEKDELLRDLQTISKELCIGLTVEQKGEFLRERLGVESFSDLRRKPNEELKTLIATLTPQEVEIVD